MNKLNSTVFPQRGSSGQKKQEYRHFIQDNNYPSIHKKNMRSAFALYYRAIWLEIKDEISTLFPQPGM
jgi:hypothetical protein